MRAEMVWGQIAPVVDLLHGLDNDALADGQQAEFVKVERPVMSLRLPSGSGSRPRMLYGEFAARQAAELGR
jgi:hypothetical protein